MSCFSKFRLTHGEFFLLALTIFLQLLIAAIPDPFPGSRVITDIDDYRNWLRVLTLQGLEVAYWGDVKPQVDYPPLIPYLHIALGSTLHAISPSAFFNHDVINFLIKIPPIMANGLIGYLLVIESRSMKLTLHRFAVPLFFFSPPLIFDIAYWGQTDSITCLFLLCSLLLLKREQLIASFVFFTVACFVKPLAWPFSFLILTISLYQFSLRQILKAVAAALLTAALILLPFILTDNFIRILIRLFTQLDVQPFISINAHNFWWVVATPAGRWTNSLDLVFGLVSYKVIATGLFLIFNLVILLKAWGNLKHQRFDLLHTASMVAMAFFIFSPQMHENHLFNFFPLAFLWMLQKNASPSHIRCYALLTACSFFNMLLHDHFLMERTGQFLWSNIISPESDVARMVYQLVMILLRLLNALIICIIFAQLLWEYLLARPIPKTWHWGIGLVLGTIAMVRTTLYLTGG